MPAIFKQLRQVINLKASPLSPNVFLPIVNLNGFSMN